jgi:hypothetical protein
MVKENARIKQRGANEIGAPISFALAVIFYAAKPEK